MTGIPNLQVILGQLLFTTLVVQRLGSMMIDAAFAMNARTEFPTQPTFWRSIII